MLFTVVNFQILCALKFPVIEYASLETTHFATVTKFL